MHSVAKPGVSFPVTPALSQPAVVSRRWEGVPTLVVEVRWHGRRIATHAFSDVAWAGPHSSWPVPLPGSALSPFGVRLSRRERDGFVVFTPEGPRRLHTGEACHFTLDGFTVHARVDRVPRLFTWDWVLPTLVALVIVFWWPAWKLVQLLVALVVLLLPKHTFDFVPASPPAHLLRLSAPVVETKPQARFVLEPARAVVPDTSSARLRRLSSAGAINEVLAAAEKAAPKPVPVPAKQKVAVLSEARSYGLIGIIGVGQGPNRLSAREMPEEVELSAIEGGVAGGVVGGGGVGTGGLGLSGVEGGVVGGFGTLGTSGREKNAFRDDVRRATRHCLGGEHRLVFELTFGQPLYQGHPIKELRFTREPPSEATQDCVGAALGKLKAPRELLGQTMFVVVTR